MKRYLSVSVGASPDEAQEIFISDDAGLIELVVACLVARLERSVPAEMSLLALH